MKPKAPFVRNPYNYDTNEAGDESGLNTGTDGGAKQSFKDECDINNIIERFGLGYELPETHRLPQYGDFSDITDFHSAMNATALARESFDQLPAKIREKFNHDPGQYVDYCLDEKNLAGLKEMGLLSPEAIDRLNKLEAEAANKAAGGQTTPPNVGG